MLPYSGNLLRKKTFANFTVLWLFTKVFSVKFGGVASFGAAQASNSRKFSPSKVSRFTVFCTVSKLSISYVHVSAPGKSQNCSQCFEHYHIALNFPGSLISQISRIFKRSRKYFNKNFWHTLCSVHMQQICKNISTKSSKIAIHKNLDPQKFSAIQYFICFNCEFYSVNVFSGPDTWCQCSTSKVHMSIL